MDSWYRVGFYTPAPSGHHIASQSVASQYDGRDERARNALARSTFGSDRQAVAAHSWLAENERNTRGRSLHPTTASPTTVSSGVADIRRAASSGAGFRLSSAGVGASDQLRDWQTQRPRIVAAAASSTRNGLGGEEAMTLQTLTRTTYLCQPAPVVEDAVCARNAFVIEAMVAREAVLLESMADREQMLWAAVSEREIALRRELAARDATLLRQRADMAEAHRLVQLYLAAQQHQVLPAEQQQHAVGGGATVPTGAEKPRVVDMGYMTSDEDPAQPPPISTGSPANMPSVSDGPARDHQERGAPPPPRPPLPGSALSAAPFPLSEAKEVGHDGWRCTRPTCRGISSVQERVACVYCGQSYRCVNCKRVGGADVSYSKELGMYRMRCDGCHEMNFVPVAQIRMD